MASRLTTKILIPPFFGRTVHTCRGGIMAPKETLSTQIKPKVDVDKLSVNDGPSAWKLCAAVCLIRLPIQEDKMSDFEQKYLALKEQLEYENSILNDWELEKIRQVKLIQEIESGKKNPEDIDFKETQQDLEDSYDASYKEFKDSSTELDPNADSLTDIDRRPRDSLVLITKQTLGNDTVWMIPCIEWQEHEELRESADRALVSYCGQDTGANIMSNAPSGFYKYKFPKGAREDARVGAKLFIYNAFLQRNSSTKAVPEFKMDPVEKDKVLDYAWVAKDEIRNYMKPKFVNVIDKLIL